MHVSKQPASGGTVGHRAGRRFAFAIVCAALLALALWISGTPSSVVIRKNQDRLDELVMPAVLRGGAPSALNKRERVARPANPYLQHGSDNATGAAGSGFDDPDAGSRYGGLDVPEGADQELLEGIVEELRMSIEEEQQAPVVVVGPAARNAEE